MTLTNDKPFACVLVKITGDKGDEFYVELHQDRRVAAYPTVEAGIAAIEKAYNRKHAVSYEGSMSACMNYMYFHRAVVACKDVDDLRAKVFGGVPDADLRVVSLSHLSGYVLGLKADQELAAKAWKRAKKPKLITEGFDAVKQQVERERTGAKP